jgi:hypothetical protein
MRFFTLFAGEHQVSHLEPVTKRLVCVLKDDPCDTRELITVLSALPALPQNPGSKPTQ